VDDRIVEMDVITDHDQLQALRTLGAG